MTHNERFVSVGLVHDVGSPCQAGDESKRLANSVYDAHYFFVCTEFFNRLLDTDENRLANWLKEEPCLHQEAEDENPYVRDNDSGESDG